MATWVGVDGEEEWPEAFLEREKKRMPPGEVDELDVGDDSLEEARKMPLKLMRRGERGGDSWENGNTVLGEPGLVLGRTGADTGLEGRRGGPLEKKPLEGLPDLKGLSALREECFSELSRSPSRNGMANELRSGMSTRSERLFGPGFLLPLPPGLGTSFFFLASMAEIGRAHV